MRLSLWGPRRDSRNRRRTPCRPRIERVEDRLLMAVFLVTNAADSGAGSLRDAIETADATPGQNTIDFDIPVNAGGTISRIELLSPLPALSNPAIVDGTSEPRYAGTPLIVIDGAGAGAGVNGLTLVAGESAVEGLTIDGFPGAQVVLTTNGGDTISGDYIGTDPTGSSPRGGAGPGILVLASDNTIGGLNGSARNLISGNAGDGITILGSNNLIINNEIGTNVASSQAAIAAPTVLPVANGGNGVTVVSGTGNMIGGATGSMGNVIAGNRHDGVLLESSGNLVQGNLIGVFSSTVLTVTGSSVATQIISNGDDGIGIAGGSGNTIGGSVAPAGNIISGNLGNGIAISGAGTTGNLVINNAIGTDALSGNTSTTNNVVEMGIGNALNGILITAGASDNTIGGSATGFANVISANQDNGISINAGSGNLVQGNFIGTDSTGTTHLGNELDGVYIEGNSNTTGGTSLADGNTIRYNDGAGVHVGSGAYNAILTNSIFVNDQGGIRIDAPSNGQINAPVLKSAKVKNGKTTISGTLRNVRKSTYMLQFFTDTALDPSGSGEGETFLGAITLRTSARGSTSFEAVIPESVASGLFITATATDATSNTSAFSNAIDPVAISSSTTSTTTPASSTFDGTIVNASLSPIANFPGTTGAHGRNPADG